MRTIKFRGKSTRTNEWVYGSFHEPNYIVKIKQTVICGVEATSFQSAISVDIKTVGQFIGLYDFNGQEIYEGDIISVNKPDSLRYAVEYDDSTARFKMVSANFTDGIEQDKINMTKMVVIGNVIDDPKLMEGGDK